MPNLATPDTFLSNLLHPPLTSGRCSSREGEGVSADLTVEGPVACRDHPDVGDVECPEVACAMVARPSHSAARSPLHFAGVCATEKGEGGSRIGNLSLKAEVALVGGEVPDPAYVFEDLLVRQQDELSIANDRPCKQQPVASVRCHWVGCGQQARQPMRAPRSFRSR